WRNKTSRLQTAGAKFIARRCDSAERLVVIEIVKLALVCGVEASKKLVAYSFVRVAWPFMKIAVDDNFITGRLQISQPGNELSIFSGQALMAIIGHNEKRTGGHATKDRRSEEHTS